MMMLIIMIMIMMLLMTMSTYFNEVKFWYEIFAVLSEIPNYH